MFQLCQRVEEGLTELRGILEAHIIEYGSAVVENNAEAAINDPKLYVSQILDVHKTFHTLVVTAFQSEPGFVKALDKVPNCFPSYRAGP